MYSKPQNPEKILKNKEQIIKMDTINVLESKREPGRYVLGDERIDDFVTYDGGTLNYSLDLEEDNRMFTFLDEFYIHEDMKDKRLSLYISPVDYPLDIYLNGILIYDIGRYEDEYNSLRYHVSEVFLPLQLLNHGSVANIIAIQAFPKQEIKPLEYPLLAYSDRIKAKAFWQSFFNVELVKAIFVVAILICLYLLFDFFIKGFKDTKYFFFAMTCFFFGLSVVNMTFYYGTVDEVFVEKISRFAYPMAILFITLFSMKATGVLYKNRWIKGLLIAGGVICSIIIFPQPSKHMVKSVFDTVMIAYIAPALFFNIGLLLYSIIKHKNKTSIVILISFLFVISTAIYDIVFLSIDVIPYVYLASYGFLAMVIGIFFLLAYEQAQIYYQSIARAKELDHKNDSLKAIINDISQLTVNTTQSSNKLEENMRITMEVMENFRDSNKHIKSQVLEKFDQIDRIVSHISHIIEDSVNKIPKAVENQTSTVEEITATISNMDSQFSYILNSTYASNAVAKNLSHIANQSSGIVKKSKESMDKLSEHSRFINGVLTAIEDITEQTGLLAMNASIEAARAGKWGQGFSVVAGEIRNLSQQSKESLSSSQDKINEMFDIINRSNELSDKVYQSLNKVIKESNLSADKINETTSLIKEQKEDFSGITQAVQGLLKDTITIKELSEENKEEITQVNNIVGELRESFSEIADLLKQQETKEMEFQKSVKNIRDIAMENIKNIDTLNNNVVKNGNMGQTTELKGIAKSE
jgi:methyl-accepting chemotaxis protein